MSLSINKVILAGNLTRDPAVKQVGNSPLAEFGLAVNRRFKKADGTLGEEVTFVDVDSWGKQAEFCGKYLTKGQGVYIEGRLKLEGWETANGEKRQRLKVIADTIQFTTPKRDGAGPPATGGAAASTAPRPGPAANPADDEPPF